MLVLSVLQNVTIDAILSLTGGGGSLTGASPLFVSNISFNAGFLAIVASLPASLRPSLFFYL